MKGIHCPNKACKRQVGVIRNGGVHITCPRCKGDVLALTQVGIKDSEGVTQTVYVEKKEQGGIRMIHKAQRLPWTPEEQTAYGDLAAWFMNHFKGQILGVADKSASGYINWSSENGTEIICPLQEMRAALEAAIGNGRFWLRVFPEFVKGVNDDGSQYARCYCRLYVVEYPEAIWREGVVLDVVLGSARPRGDGGVHWKLQLSASGSISSGVLEALPDAKYTVAKRINNHRWLITAQEGDTGSGSPQEWELNASYDVPNSAGLRFYRVK